MRAGDLGGLVGRGRRRSHIFCRIGREKKDRLLSLSSLFCVAFPLVLCPLSLLCPRSAAAESCRRRKRSTTRGLKKSSTGEREREREMSSRVFVPEEKTEAREKLTFFKKRRKEESSASLSAFTSPLRDVLRRRGARSPPRGPRRPRRGPDGGKEERERERGRERERQRDVLDACRRDKRGFLSSASSLTSFDFPL